MSKKIILIIGIVILVLIGVVVFLYQSAENSKYPPNMTAKQKTQLKKLEKAHEELIKRSKSGKFLVSGKVVDERGKLLEGVKVRIVTRLVLGIMPSKSYTNKTEIVNGNFKIEANGGSSIQLEFYKQGYFSAKKEYITGCATDKDKNIISDETHLAAQGQIIVLRAMGKLAKLRSKDAKFYMDPASKEQDIMDLISFKKVKVKNAKNITTPKYFYLSTKVDKYGKPEMLPDEGKKLVPTKVFLNYVSNDKTDGLIPVIGVNIKDMRDLPTAPPKGYNIKQVPLKINSHDGDFYYYKNGDTYGKIWVQQTDFLLGKVECVMLIKQNNDKDPQERRNLRSIAY